MDEWIAFYNPEGRLLTAYTKRDTFPGEYQNTLDLLAAEHGLRPEDITVKTVKGSEI